MERSVGSLTIPGLVDEIIAQVSSARDPGEEEAPASLERRMKTAPIPARAGEDTEVPLVA